MNKKFFVACMICCLSWIMNPAYTQNVGIGTGTPTEKLDVNGGIKIGNTLNAVKGTIRWNESRNDFEGYNGESWVSLTSGKGNWGSGLNSVTESYSSQSLLFLDSVGSKSGKALGRALATNGNLVAAGVPFDYHFSGTILNFGTVRLFRKTIDGWAGYQTLYPGDLTTESQFGSGVALEDSMLIVGAASAKVGNNFGQGKVYLYSLSGNGMFNLHGTLTASLGHSQDHFGASVGISGTNAVVGTPGYDFPTQLSRGVVYFYAKNSSNFWYQHSLVYPPDGQEGDLFGQVVRISGNTAAISSPNASVNGKYIAGKVYLYELINNVWTLTSTLISPVDDNFERFGHDIYLKGDTLIVGSTQYQGTIEGKKGLAYVYVRNAGTWNLQATLSPVGARSGEAFGSSVHFSNGYIIVGARYADVNSNQGQGKAYLFRQSGNNWVQETVLIASNGKYSDSFGSSVILTPGEAVIGSPNAEYQGWPGHGRLYFFEK